MIDIEADRSQANFAFEEAGDHSDDDHLRRSASRVLHLASL
jgi:hypothetical protein